MKIALQAIGATAIILSAHSAGAAMTFESCSALNRGENKPYALTYEAANKRIFKVDLEVNEEGTIEKMSSANARLTQSVPLGFIGVPTSTKEVTELATGETKTFEVVVSRGTDLATVLSTMGSTRYEQQVRVLENGKWQEGPARDVQITVKENGPAVVSGCSVATVLIDIANINSGGQPSSRFRRIVYAPTAKLTVKSSDYDGAEGILYRQILELEPR